MSESNPLEGLTADEADEAIERFQAKVDQADEELRARKDHLKAMKAARKTLEEPTPVSEQGLGAAADAQPADIAVNGSGA